MSAGNGSSFPFSLAGCCPSTCLPGEEESSESYQSKFCPLLLLWKEGKLVFLSVWHLQSTQFLPDNSSVASISKSLCRRLFSNLLLTALWSYSLFIHLINNYIIQQSESYWTWMAQWIINSKIWKQIPK